MNRVKRILTNEGESIVTEVTGMNERMKKQNKDQEVLKERYLIAEYIDENDNYVKVKYRETEAYRFFLRFCSAWFHPCPSCQQKLKQLISNSKNMILFMTAGKVTVTTAIFLSLTRYTIL